MFVCKCIDFKIGDRFLGGVGREGGGGMCFNFEMKVAKKDEMKVPNHA